MNFIKGNYYIFYTEEFMTLMVYKEGGKEMALFNIIASNVPAYQMQVGDDIPWRKDYNDHLIKVEDLENEERYKLIRIIYK